MKTLLPAIIFTLFATSAFGQLPDSLVADTVVRQKFVPTGLRVGIDLISPIKSQVTDYFTGWEATADVDVHRYLLSADFGSWSVNGQRDSTGYLASYKNDGNYWRAGISANFLTRDPERNAFFIGMKYGRATYTESMEYLATDTLWGPGQASFSDKKNARWFELASGIRIKIWKFIWMGYTGSIKFGLKADDSNGVISYDVPGYGKTFRDTTWGFTYQLFFRIPFRPTTPILPAGMKK